MKILPLLLAIQMLSVSNPYPVQEEPIQQGYIFVGDSRTVGMEQAVSNAENKDNVKFIAKVGVGISFLEIAQEEIMQIVENAPDTQWTIICNLGVNDLGNAEKYAKAYQDMNLQYTNFYVVSVNPVVENGMHYATNDKIIAFNELMQQQDFAYIDTYSEILDSFQTQDGLHYNADTYRDIFDIVIQYVEQPNTNTQDIFWIPEFSK